MKNIKSRHPVPFKYRRKYNGALPDKPDPRNIEFQEVCGKIPVDTPTWEESYDVEDAYTKMKVENQFSSSSCVSQAWQYYLQMLNIIEEGEFTDLSARFIYSHIHLPDGGAYIKDGARLAVNTGTCEEEIVPSYKEDGTTDEQWMRNKEFENITLAYMNANIYRAKTYATILHDSPDLFEQARQAIYQYNGLVSGFQGHAIWFKGYGIKNGKRFLKYKNSWDKDWGDNGDGYLFEDDRNLLYSLWTLVDRPNDFPKTKMLKTIKTKKDNRTYAVLKDKEDKEFYIWITSDRMYNSGVKNDMWLDWDKIVEVDSIDPKKVIGTFNKEY